MNTPDTNPNALQEKGFGTELITTAKRPGQVYTRILVATDFSACATAAFEQGLKIAKQNHAELLIAHSSVLPNDLCFMPSNAYWEWEKKSRAEAENNMSALLEKARQENVNAHILALEGIADDAIVETAKRLGVDLIVIGAHGYRKASRFFWGSVVAPMIVRAPCAVLTVHSPVPTA
jgi:nucleotide-binding universal stress UspA family protein